MDRRPEQTFLQMRSGMFRVVWLKTDIPSKNTHKWPTGIQKDVRHHWLLPSEKSGPSLLMLKLKLQYFGHLMQKVDSLEKTLVLGGIGGRRRREWQRMRWLMESPTWWAWVWVNSGSWWWTGRPGVLWFMGLQRVGHDWATKLNWVLYCCWRCCC